MSLFPFQINSPAITLTAIPTFHPVLAINGAHAHIDLVRITRAVGGTEAPHFEITFKHHRGFTLAAIRPERHQCLAVAWRGHFQHLNFNEVAVTRCRVTPASAQRLWKWGRDISAFLFHQSWSWSCILCLAAGHEGSGDCHRNRFHHAHCMPLMTSSRTGTQCRSPWCPWPCFHPRFLSPDSCRRR
jgi:hypothetical protein